MNSSKLNAFLNGAGFYIVLFLAIAIIGASGYFIYDAVAGGRNAVEQPANSTVLTEQPEHEPAGAKDAENRVTTPSEHETVTVSKTVPVADEPEKSAEKADSRVVRPLTGDIVTAFSVDALLYNDAMGDWRTHDGMDIAAAAGTEVVAAASGKVTSIVDDYWMGTTVTTRSADGVELVYSSLQSTPPVAAGDTVRAGDVIGKVGATAPLEAGVGNHLHFAVLENGKAVDPGLFLKEAG